MRAYADTSYLVKLVTNEPGSAEAMAQFRRLGFLRLFFLPLHALEVTNAIRHRAFCLRRSPLLSPPPVEAFCWPRARTILQRR